ncbi:MAG: glycoside hydrolase family 2 [Tannerella sp.]|jgi:beta-galactosidase|nr:glycoside hydrolase family 2 [Tannerella sp.]
MKKKYLLFAIPAVCSIFSVLASDENVQKQVYPYAFAPAEGLVNRYEKPQRQELCINGLWDFQAVPLPADYRQGKGVAPELPEPSAGAWDNVKIKIPSPWNINSFANRGLEGPDHRNFPSYPASWEQVKMAWMRKTVTVPADWSGKTIKLHFEAVAGFAEVYVNHKKVAENFDLFLPFDADITDVAEPGKSIEIRVGVRSQSLFEDHSTIGRRIVPAGSMWGYHIAGIWQDVFLTALPEVHIEDVFVKPRVSENRLELEVTICNHSKKKESLTLQGTISEWLNKAGNEVNSAPVPAWELGRKALDIPVARVTVEAGQSLKQLIGIPVSGNVLACWTPDEPNLYGLVLNLTAKKQTIDTKYERFGWREWTIRSVAPSGQQPGDGAGRGGVQYLNGKPFELRGDSWHFMGVPQMTRRYAWAWFKAIKDANGNAVRPHAQIYPRFYLDMADEMGICVMNETAIWASDGGPKMDAPQFWEACKEHIRRFVLRDRNHASVFGWSVSNENKPVIRHVFNRPDLMAPQMQAWRDWLEIVTTNDPTRPWVSSDGEDDGDGILPVTVGHYGDTASMKRWAETGKPWGIGEHSMAYYGTPEQVAKYNGERAYESQQGRMEGLANECYHLIAGQRNMHASYVSVFNLAWYSLKPLPFGKKDLTAPPSLTGDGIFFENYTEGLPGIQPERIGPYCSTFNPGYDPNLPLYEPWPMFDAIRAANAPGGPAWSEWKDAGPAKKAGESGSPDGEGTHSGNRNRYEDTSTPPGAGKKYSHVIYIGSENTAGTQNVSLKNTLLKQGVSFSPQTFSPSTSLFIIDGSVDLDAANEKLLMHNMAKGADLWIWGITSQTSGSYRNILPLPLTVEPRTISSFLPVSKSWMKGLRNSDFYFCEVQRADASLYGLAGPLADEAQVLLNACNTDWRKWNKRPEEIKTAATLRSENERKGAAPAFIRYSGEHSDIYISTLTEFANSEKGFNTLSAMLENAGIACEKTDTSVEDLFFIRDGALQFPASAGDKFRQTAENQQELELWIWSNRPLDDLLIEPDMPKLSLSVHARESSLDLNGTPAKRNIRNPRDSDYIELPLQQGWNRLLLKIGANDKNDFSATFNCNNRSEFLETLKISFENQAH